MMYLFLLKVVTSGVKQVAKLLAACAFSQGCLCNNSFSETDFFLWNKNYST